MVEIGYTLSSEEFPPQELVRHARKAEEAGFTFALIADHFHPWTDKQGQSPFVWSALGGVAQVTKDLEVGTGVTCPIIRMHPALVAQAAATTACMMPGRFFLGVGTGENLNEHVTGARWPVASERLDMLEEAVECMRELWKGGYTTLETKHYKIDNARIYTLPDDPPPIMIAAKGEKAARLAGRIGDGLISTVPDREVVDWFHAAGGGGKPRYAQLHVCWAPTEAEARRTALEQWPNSGIPGQLSVELAIPKYFEQAAKLVTEEHIAEAIVCGPDPDRHVAEFVKYVEAGYDHVYVHQVGHDQDKFFEFYAEKVLPQLRRELEGAELKQAGTEVKVAK